MSTLSDRRMFTPILEYEVAYYPVRPEELPELTHGFGKREIDGNAARLVQFFRERGRWCSTTLEELRSFYLQKGWNPNLMLCGLVGGWHDAPENEEEPPMLHEAPDVSIVFLATLDGSFCVTDRFVERYAGNGQRKRALRPGHERRSFVSKDRERP